MAKTLFVGVESQTSNVLVMTVETPRYHTSPINDCSGAERDMCNNAKIIKECRRAYVARIYDTQVYPGVFPHMLASLTSPISLNLAIFGNIIGPPLGLLLPLCMSFIGSSHNKFIE